MFGIIVTLIGIIISALEKDFVIILGFSLIFLSFVFSRQYLTPRINKAKDEIIKSNSNWDKSWMRIADPSASKLSTFVSGGNKVNFHKVFQTFSFMEKQFLIADIRNAKKGDRICLENNEVFVIFIAIPEADHYR